jgi:hypothetical protein
VSLGEFERENDLELKIMTTPASDFLFKVRPESLFYARTYQSPRTIDRRAPSNSLLSTSFLSSFTNI